MTSIILIALALLFFVLSHKANDYTAAWARMIAAIVLGLLGIFVFLVQSLQGLIW